MLTELKSEKNFELAVKIFEISDELCFKENRKYHKITRQQARRTTAECLNVIFKDENNRFPKRKHHIISKAGNVCCQKGSYTIFKRIYRKRNCYLV